MEGVLFISQMDISGKEDHKWIKQGKKSASVEK
jgi:hypothetical protein